MNSGHFYNVQISIFVFFIHVDRSIVFGLQLFLIVVKGVTTYNCYNCNNTNSKQHNTAQTQNNIIQHKLKTTICTERWIVRMFLPYLVPHPGLYPALCLYLCTPMTTAAYIFIFYLFISACSISCINGSLALQWELAYCVRLLLRATPLHSRFQSCSQLRDPKREEGGIICIRLL